MSTTRSVVTPAGSGVDSRAFKTLPGDHRFFSVMAIVSAVTIVAGFSNTYVPKVV